MVKVELLLFSLVMWAADSKVLHHNRHQIMTPTIGQTGNPLPSQGNINENAMFPPQISNSLASDITINEEEMLTTPTIPITSDITSTDASVEPTGMPSTDASVEPTAMPSTDASVEPTVMPSTDASVEPTVMPRTVVETVTSIGSTVIRVEIPSSINIYVNITNGGQPTVVDVSNGGATIEIPTVESTVATSTVDSAPTEASTTSVDISTVMDTDVVSNSDRSIDLTTTDSTSEVSTTEVITETPILTTSTESSIDEMSTIEIEPSTDTGMTMNDTSTVDTTTEMSTADSTMEISTADITVEMSTADSTVEASVTATTVEMSTEESTVDTSTVGDAVDVSTVDSTVDMSTGESTTEMAMTENTTDVATTESVSETSTIEVAVEIITENRTGESNPPVESSTETMAHIQININLSDNTQNVNFGSTTQPPSGNMGQLQDKMIYKEKCDEYYSSSRAVRTAKVQVFIVGGTNSLPKEFPHMAALGYGSGPKKEWLCGGSLISENYVITAAHCVSSKTSGDVQVVRLGTTILNTETLDSEDYNVIRRIPHPDYNNGEQYNDLALLQLDHPVTFSEYISPICLFSSNVTEEVLVATGWGKTEATGDVSDDLQKVELEYFPNQECQDSYSVVSKQDLPRGIVAETQICAGSRSEVKDTCQGDSGGPLQIQDNGRMYIVGITSFGIGCGKPGRPGVYTRVSYFIPWIENIVWGNGR